MQVEIETKPKVYEPKTLKITFETEEERSMFNDLLSLDRSVPAVVYATPHRQAKLTQMMNSIQRALLKG